MRSIKELCQSNLILRLVSAFILGPIVLYIIFLGHFVFSGAIIGVALLGMREWLRMVDPKASLPVVALSYGSLLLILSLGCVINPALGAGIGTFLTLVLFLFSARDHEDRAGWVTAGLPYMAGFGLALITIRSHDHGGMISLYYVIAVVWATDIGAYGFGRLLGGPKLVPTISPKKTWAGLWGGMALASLVGFAIAWFYQSHTPLILAGFAGLLALVSQLGDLFESYIKRRSGIKESGGLIPGHGGVLDRIDGLIFAAIFFVLTQVALGRDLVIG